MSKHTTDYYSYTNNSPLYPQWWSNLRYPPAKIWTSANLDQPPWQRVFEAPRLAVIGSRQASVYAQAITKQFVTNLVKALGVVIVSGCARGVDSYAHQAALAAGGYTIGLLGSGLNQITYRQQSIFEHPRALLISEFAPLAPAYKSHFVKRNRLISGSADGLLVVEASKRSGTLITVNYALEQGKEVFVIPQSLWNKNYEGVCHLVNLGAQLVTSPQQIARELWGVGTTEDTISDQQVILQRAQDNTQRKILRLLMQHQGRMLQAQLLAAIKDEEQSSLQALQQKGVVSNTFGVMTLSV